MLPLSGSKNSFADKVKLEWTAPSEPDWKLKEYCIKWGAEKDNYTNMKYVYGNVTKLEIDILLESWIIVTAIYCHLQDGLPRTIICAESNSSNSVYYGNDLDIQPSTGGKIETTEIFENIYQKEKVK